VKGLDTRDKITSRTQYGLDARPDGVAYAVMARCPVFGGKVASLDAADAKKVPGVRDVIQITGWDQYQMPGGVAVIADNTWSAIQGRKALKVTWDEGLPLTSDPRQPDPRHPIACGEPYTSRA